jgi:hypothetical protein
MKTIFLIGILSVGFLPGSFSKQAFIPAIAFQNGDTIPELNKKVIAYINTKINKKIATGECWDVAAEALKYAGATWDGMYKFGREINYKKESVLPGDIIQFENVVLNYQVGNRKFTEKMAHHTAVIYEVKDKDNFILAHQNNGYSGRKVGLSPLDITTLTKGKFRIYRPVN